MAQKIQLTYQSNVSDSKTKDAVEKKHKIKDLEHAYATAYFGSSSTVRLTFHEGVLTLHKTQQNIKSTFTCSIWY